MKLVLLFLAINTVICQTDPAKGIMIARCGDWTKQSLASRFISLGKTPIEQKVSWASVNQQVIHRKRLRDDFNAYSEDLMTIVTRPITKSGQFLVRAIPALIALASLIAFLIPAFIICCCPQSCCCSFDRCFGEKSRRRSSLRCCAFFNMLLCCGVIVVGLYGYFKLPRVADGYQRAACSMEILLDDWINGNSNLANNASFSGVYGLANSTIQLNSSYDSFEAKFNTQKSNSQQTRASLTTLNSVISRIPTGTGEQQLALTYQLPLDSASPNQPYNSLLIKLLGTPTNSGSAIADYTKAVSSLSNTLAQRQKYFTAFISAKNDFKGTSKAAIGDMLQAVTVSKNRRSIIQDILNVKDPTTLSKITQAVIYFGFTAVGLVMGLISLSLLWYPKGACKEIILRGLCSISFIVGLAASLAASGIILAQAVGQSGCTFLLNGLESETAFQNNFKKILSAEYIDTTKRCLLVNDGNYIKTIKNTAVLNSFNSLETLISSIQSLEILGQYTAVTNQSTLSVSLLANHASSQFLDISNTESLAFFARLASAPTSFDCPNFNDYWVPHPNRCPPNAPTPVVCTAATFSSLACQGCFIIPDTVLKFGLTEVTSRYSGCAALATAIEHVFNNYYSPKTTALRPVITRASDAQSGASTAITNAQTTQNNLGVLNGELKATAKYPNDCRVLIEDFMLLRSTMCDALLSYTQANYQLITAIAWLSLFMIILSSLILRGMAIHTVVPEETAGWGQDNYKQPNDTNRRFNRNNSSQPNEPVEGQDGVIKDLHVNPAVSQIILDSRRQTMERFIDKLHQGPLN